MEMAEVIRVNPPTSPTTGHWQLSHIPMVIEFSSLHYLKNEYMIVIATTKYSIIATEKK